MMDAFPFIKITLLLLWYHHASPSFGMGDMPLIVQFFVCFYTKRQSEKLLSADVASLTRYWADLAA